MYLFLTKHNNYMRRISLVLLTIIFTGIAAIAQPSSKVLPVKIDLGIKIGANFQNLGGEQWEQGYKPGFVGGIFGGVSGKRFGVSAEALFSQVRYTGNGVKFFRRNGNAGNSNYNNLADSTKKGDFAVTYINIPILLNVKVVGPLWFQVGPQYSGVLAVSDKDQLLKDTKDLFKSGDLAAVLGLQLNLPIHLRVSARYIIGLSDMNASSISDEWKTRTIQLGVGYSFL